MALTNAQASLLDRGDNSSNTTYGGNLYVPSSAGKTTVSAIPQQLQTGAWAPTQQMQNGGWYNGTQYWAPGQGPSTGGSVPTSNNNVPAGPSQADIDAAFNPELDALNQIQSGLTSDRDSQLTAAQGQHDNQAGVVGGQVTGLQGNLAKNQLDWNNTTQGAYADSLRAYNALQQRSGALYGGQSSAGQAANDLLNQTYLQQQGGIGQSDASAQLAFKGQDQDIQNWSADQHAKLDNWLLDAQNNIKGVFQQGLNQINADRGSTESAKSQAKLGLLQQLFTHQQALQDYDNQLRMQVELAAKNLPQGQLDTTNYQNQMSAYGQAQQNASQGFVPYQSAPTPTANNTFNLSYNPTTKKYNDTPGLTFSQ